MSGRLDTKQQTDAMDENQYLDRKSLRVISRDHGDFPGLARDCVCFANSAGDKLVIGVEDDPSEPPPGQRIDKSQLERIRKRIFHDIGLMERAGSGFDLMYDRLLATGRGTPVATEGVDSVHITIPRRVIHPAIIGLIAEADKNFQLTQRERIALGLLAQSESLSAGEFASKLELPDPGALREWVARMLEIGLVERSGRTKATRYSAPSKLLRSSLCGRGHAHHAHPRATASFACADHRRPREIS